jgi:integrase
MAHAPPTLRQHKTGVWFVRWGGRDHYFSMDRADSERAFHDPRGEHPGAMVNWSAWRGAVLESRQAAGRQRHLTMVEIAERWLEGYAAEGRLATARKFRGHLSRFLHVTGRLRADELSLRVLLAWRSDLLGLMQPPPRGRGLAPRTINHDIGAVKGMLKWAAENELAPPIALGALRKVPAPPPAFERLTREQVLGMVSKAEKADRDLACYVALTYLCVIRPSETVRLVLGQGHFDAVTMPDGSVHPRGVFVLPEHKTARRVSFPRHVILSDEALVWLDSVRPRWSRLDSFSAACRATCGRGPKLLQKAACWHLQLAGVPEEDIDQVQGHAVPGVRRHYRRAELGRLRDAAGRLTLRSSG